MRFGEKLRRLREATGESQTKIAKKVGKTQGKWSEWENGKEKLEIEMVLKLANLFHVSCDYLIRDEIEDPQYTPGSESPASPDVFKAEDLWESLSRKVDSDTRFALESIKRFGPPWVVDAIMRKIRNPDNPGNPGTPAHASPRGGETLHLKTTVTPVSLRPTEPENPPPQNQKPKAKNDRPK